MTGTMVPYVNGAGRVLLQLQNEDGMSFPMDTEGDVFTPGGTYPHDAEGVWADVGLEASGWGSPIMSASQKAEQNKKQKELDKK